MALEETTSNPLEDGHSNVVNKIFYFFYVIIWFFTQLNSLVEELREGFKRVLIHGVNNVHFDEQEIKHGSFSSNRSVDFTRFSNNFSSNFGNSLLFLNISGSLFSYFKTFNERKVFKNSSCISIRKVLQEFFTQPGQSNFWLVLLCNKLISLLFEIGLFNSDDFG